MAPQPLEGATAAPGALAGGIGFIAGIAEVALGSGPLAYPIGPLPVALCLLSMASAIGIAFFGIVAAISAFRHE